MYTGRTCWSAPPRCLRQYAAMTSAPRRGATSVSVPHSGHRTRTMSIPPSKVPAEWRRPLSTCRPRACPASSLQLISGALQEAAKNLCGGCEDRQRAAGRRSSVTSHRRSRDIFVASSREQVDGLRGDAAMARRVIVPFTGAVVLVVLAGAVRSHMELAPPSERWRSRSAHRSAAATPARLSASAVSPRAPVAQPRGHAARSEAVSV